MYPARVSDAHIRAIIAELTVGSVLPSGAAVRAVLAARFNSRGGVARIYRLLSGERTRLQAGLEAGSVQALQAQLLTLRERLARAEQREDAHQARWAEEVDRLRRQTQISRESAELLRHQLQASQQRVAALEQQLSRLRGRAE
jgi:hypothetical protein